MKTALISFRDIQLNYSAGAEESLVWAFNAGGIRVDDITVLSVKDDLGFGKRFGELEPIYDNIVILCSDETTFDVKGFIAKKLGVGLAENANARKFIEEYNERTGKTGGSEYALLPEGSTVIPNFSGVFQGFLAEGDYTVTLLPNEPEAFGAMCANYILPYFEKKYKTRYDKITLKLFGVKKSELEPVLREAKKLAKNKIEYNAEYTYGDVRLNLVYDNNTPKMLADDAVRHIVSAFRDRIYAEEDFTLEKCLFNLLSLHKKKISFAESFTAGRVAAALISVAGASGVVNEGVTAYSNHAKMKRLKVKEETLKQFGAVSSQTAFQMAAGLLEDAETDVAVSTTGIAGPKSDDTKKPVGLAFIAVGGRSGVHVHKMNFSGDREEITETAKNTALYYAIAYIREGEL
ncbi:MAG: hypothetical protein DBX59_03295 [Bacillota bacterium]|nr:MAG: hypothetical protein DBX59_03295 [Bacillota bacterium]